MAQDFLDPSVHPRTATADTTDGSASVTTSSGVLVPSKPDRRFLYLVNDSTSNVYLSFGGTATLNEGIRLGSSGGSLLIDLNNLYTGAISGIVSSGTATVTFIEG